MNMTPPGGRAAQWSQELLVDAITQALAAAGEPPATSDDYQRLQQEGLLELAEQGELSTDQLAASIREWRADVSSEARANNAAAVGVSGGATPPPAGSETPQPLMLPAGEPLPDEPMLARRYAISRILAASLDEDVTIWERITRFRQEHLGGRPLAWEAVDAWVAAHQSGDAFRPQTYWLSDIPISREQIEWGAKTAPVGHTTLSLTITTPLPWPDRLDDQRSSRIGRLEPKQLEYLTPGHENSRRAFVEAGGALHTLWELAKDLAPAHRHDPQADTTRRPWWTRAQASTFVLTGLAPFVAAYEALQVDLDPTTPLKDIIAQVTQARLRLVGARARELSHKHLQMAVFSVERSDEPWATRQEAWNVAYPEWKYPEKQKSNFIRDSLAAKRRLLLQER